ncbi:hypothetical protein K2173_021376 [Erythroxylum novogranatense]|uniref:RRM domain-containing protein n=1 Tax=Erythroxylum novogranatense TaxID=1862640 RepID=A0AAV8TXW7_9ROSI|nr:hypothetical protein K2173_021376 [Erythroxylum novogranatense]
MRRVHFLLRVFLRTYKFTFFSGNSPDMNLLVYSAADVSDVTLNLKQFCNLGHVFHHMSTSSASPCPALFVANLGLQCTEAELNQLFSRCSGFLRLKKWSTYGTADTACSTEALNLLQGTVLYSSPPGEGFRLEYPSEVD